VELIGSIVRLQIQRASLKVGPREQRRYDPTPLHPAQTVSVSAGGVTAEDEQGSPSFDVHHQDHPASKNHDGRNGVSMGFTAHYAAMRSRFGDHLTDGIAGENILVESERMIDDDALRDGVVIVTGSGQSIRLERFLIAEPCLEFTRYALRYPRDARSDGTVAEALRHLRGGMRGFYASYAGPPVTVRIGDRVYLASHKALKPRC